MGFFNNTIFNFLFKICNNGGNIAARPLGALAVLPLEIRRLIYTELLYTRHIIFISEEKEHLHDQGILTSLLLVNKTIREEFKDVLKLRSSTYKWCFSSQIKIPYVALFNPEVTTFSISSTKKEGEPLVGDWKATSLWHMLLVLYHCDKIGQLTMRPSPFGKKQLPDLSSWWTDSIHDPRPYFSASRYTKTPSNLERITYTMSLEFNIEFDLNILISWGSRWGDCPYDSAEMNCQMVRIPFAYHRQMQARGLKYDDLIREVCRLEELRKNRDSTDLARDSAPDPVTIKKKLPCYHADDEAKCLKLPLWSQSSYILRQGE